jgi:hypothetical protein
VSSHCTTSIWQTNTFFTTFSRRIYPTLYSVGHNEKIAEKGYMVYKHWVEIEGEEFAISTVINDSDYTEL